jgi:cytochrome P450
MSAVLQRPTRAAVRAADPRADFADNPYATYAVWRSQGPLLWSDAFFGGAWLLTRHADVEAALRDPALSAQRTGGWVMASAEEGQRSDFLPFQRLFARAMLFRDAPDHTRLRRVLQAAFRPEALTSLQPWLEDLLRAQMQAHAHAGTFDFMATVARPVPVCVITRLLGAPDALSDDFMRWCEDLAIFIGASVPLPHHLRCAQRSLLQMCDYFEHELLPQRRSHPRNDLASLLLQAEARGDVTAGAELLAQCAMLLFAGYETTRSLLGNAVHALLSHPEQWRRLCVRPDLAAPAVRELLRYDSPVQWTGRRATRTLHWHGQTIMRGDLVLPLIGSANRDPERHAYPDRLDIERLQPGTLSFGSGPHVCLGAWLTQLEGQTVLRMLAQHWPGLRLDGEASRNGNLLYRGWQYLPLQVS